MKLIAMAPQTSVIILTEFISNLYGLLKYLEMEFLICMICSFFA